MGIDRECDFPPSGPARSSSTLSRLALQIRCPFAKLGRPLVSPEEFLESCSRLLDDERGQKLASGEMK